MEGLRGVLKGGTVIAPDRDAFTVTDPCRTVMWLPRLARRARSVSTP
jgi:hypothetical protein